MRGKPACSISLLTWARTQAKFFFLWAAAFYVQPFNIVMKWFTLTENCCKRLLYQKRSLIFTARDNTTERTKGHRCCLLKFWSISEFSCLKLIELRLELVLSPEVCFATSVFQHYFSLFAVHYIWSSAVRQARQLGLWCYGNECIEMVASSIFRLP